MEILELKRAISGAIVASMNIQNSEKEAITLTSHIGMTNNEPMVSNKPT